MNDVPYRKQSDSTLYKIGRFLNSIFPAFFAIGLLFILIPVVTYSYFANDLSSKERIMNRNNEGIILYDRHNKPFFTFYEAKQKITIPIENIPLHIQQAVIAIEDKDFYSHAGYSVKGIARSILMNIENKEIVSGGSTITQQLVKNALLNPQKSFLRKYQEIVLAEEIERRYSKKEILEMYLNSVYFGEGAFGIEEAAETYFGIHAKDLSLSQAALLAGILPAPSRYSPLSGNVQESKERQQLVLQAMAEQKYISDKEKIKAVKQNLSFNPGKEKLNVVAPHFALMVLQELKNKYGEEQITRSGLKVQTSIDLEWQKYAEETVKEQVESLAQNNVSNGASVVINPSTGEILAMVGSKDWYDNKFGKVNLATTPRQPGSAFKPIVYSFAFQEGIITPATLLRDEPTIFSGNYRPVDYDRRYRGKVYPRRALANSLNIPAVDVMSRVGVENILGWSKQLGITTLKNPINYGLSLTLGTGEVTLTQLTAAYGIFANKGIYMKPVSILHIKDKHGKSIYTNKNVPQKVVDPAVAFLISSILSDNRARSETFGSVLNISRPAAVKTGTTDDFKDSLTVGYVPSLVIGVWVGNNNGSPMDNIAGSLGAAPIWKKLMEHYTMGSPIEEFQPPENIVKSTVCYSYPIKKEVDGKTETQIQFTQYQEYFIEGTEPRTNCLILRKLAEKKNEQTSPSPDIPTTSVVSPSPTETPSPTPFPTITIPKNLDEFIKEIKHQ